MTDLAGIERLVGAMPERRYRLYFTFGTYVLPVISAAVLGVFGTLLLDIAIGHPITSSIGFVWVVAFCALGVTGLRALWIARRQGQVWVEFSADAVREFDGDALRTAIRWDEARARVKEYARRYGTFTEPHVDIRFLGPTGDVITITDHDAGGLFPRWTHRSVARHVLTAEKHIAQKLPELDEEPDDPREVEDIGRWYARAPRAFVVVITYWMMATFVAAAGLRDRQDYMSFGLDRKLFFMGCLALAPFLEFGAQLLSDMRWQRRVRAIPSTVAAGGYRDPAPKPTLDTSAFIRGMARRSRRRLALLGALFVATLAYPWIAAGTLHRECVRLHPDAAETFCFDRPGI